MLDAAVEETINTFDGKKHKQKSYCKYGNRIMPSTYLWSFWHHTCHICEWSLSIPAVHCHQGATFIENRYKFSAEIREMCRNQIELTQIRSAYPRSFSTQLLFSYRNTGWFVKLHAFVQAYVRNTWLQLRFTWISCNLRISDDIVKYQVEVVLILIFRPNLPCSIRPKPATSKPLPMIVSNGKQIGFIESLKVTGRAKRIKAISFKAELSA